MYLPALPTITSQLGTTSSAVSSPSPARCSASGWASWCSGTLSDALGRRRRCSRAPRCTSSRRCSSWSPERRRPGRAAAAGGRRRAAGAVIAVAVVRDLYDGRAAATMLSGSSSSSVGAGARTDDRWRRSSSSPRGARLRAAGRLRRPAGRRRFFALPETLLAARRRSRGVGGARCELPRAAPRLALLVGLCSSPGSPSRAVQLRLRVRLRLPGQFGLDQQHSHSCSAPACSG